MGATIESIRFWLIVETTPTGESLKDCTHVIIVRDEFSYEDHPIYVKRGQDAAEIAAKYDGKGMQRVMEVYSLSLNIEEQLKEHRAFHYD